MKMNPEIGRITERMAAGVLSKEGFLGQDTRPLEEIIEADHGMILGQGSDDTKLAKRLGEIYQQARAGLGTTVEISKQLRAVYREAMGRIPCPWGRCGVFPKGQVELTERSTGQKLILTALGIHMIAAHSFYQGRGSPFRLDPGQIWQMLEAAIDKSPPSR